MDFYRRRLPHLHRQDQPIFLTWRLYDTLPSNRPFSSGTLSFGQAFAAMDRLLEQSRTGACYLRLPAIADMTVEAVRYNSDVLGHYLLHAFVVMPNHVHLLITPAVPLPTLTKSLKNITAKRANKLLGTSGPFWQHESYDHLVRNDREFDQIQNYIELNPVRAGLVTEANAYQWSSAARPRT
jgi:putative DNA methylase